MYEILHTPICLFDYISFLSGLSIPLFFLIVLQILTIPTDVDLNLKDKPIKIKKKLDKYGYPKYVIRFKAFYILCFPMYITHKRIYREIYTKDNPTGRNKAIAYFQSYHELLQYVERRREEFLEE